MTSSKKPQRPTLDSLLAKKPELNPSAVTTPDLKPVPSQVRAESKPADVAPEPTPEPKVEPAAPAPAPEPAKVEVAAQPAAEQQPALPPAVEYLPPVHKRIEKESGSKQLSCKVDMDVYERVEEARKKTGLSAQAMLTEGLLFWLAHNGF